MATYIPSTPSMGERIGSALGTGIGAGLTNIAEHKLQQIQQKREMDTRKDQLKKIGMNDAEAEFFADKDPETQYIAARDAIKRNLQGNEQLVDDWIPATPQEFQKADALREENIASQQQGPALEQQQLQPKANVQPTLQERLQQGMQTANQAIGIKPAMQGLGQKPTGAPKSRKSFEGLSFGTPQQGKTGGKATEEEKLQIKHYEQIKMAADNSNTSDMRLDRMDRLVEDDKINNPVYVALIKAAGINGWGIDLSGLLNKDTQEYDKLATDFVKDAKALFGAKITNDEVKLFLKTIPSTLNSKDAKIAMSRNIRTMNEGLRVKRQLADQIVQQNGGTVPSDFDLRLEQAFKPYQTNLAERFKNGITQAQQAQQSQMETGNRLKALPEDATDGTEITNRKTNVTYVRKNGEWIERGK
jgi:hypothetical protein